MDRQRLLKRLAKAWRAFQESYAGLSDSQMMEPGVTAAWSVRDILAHVTSWEEEALKHLPLILKGRKPPRYSVTYGGIDAFNALMTEQKQNVSLPMCYGNWTTSINGSSISSRAFLRMNSEAKRASVIACVSIHTATTRSMQRRFETGAAKPLHRGSGGNR